MKNFKKIFFAVVFIAAFFYFTAIKNSDAYALTTEELMAQIQNLFDQINQLQSQLDEINNRKWCYNFENNLGFGSRGDAVEALHLALTKEGFTITIDEDRENYFGNFTILAVSGFQEKYANEILTPWGLTRGTGNVGRTTLAKLNQLYGCGGLAPSLQQPYIKVISPNRGEKWEIGNTYEVRWESYGVNEVFITIVNYAVDYSGGSSAGFCKLENGGVLGAMPGRYFWKIEAAGKCDISTITGERMKLRVESKDGKILDQSDNFFSIAQSTGTCRNQCSASGISECYQNTHKKICGNYNANVCLEWSSLQSCTGNLSCGYGTCSDSQKPNWYCSGGNCLYNCVEDSGCRQSVSCTDSDGDRDYYTKGTTTGILFTSGELKTFTDRCLGEFLEEFYCDGNIISLFQENCLYGCENGVCKKQEDICVNQCSSVGEKRCLDSSRAQICEDFNYDGCLEWKNQYTCGLNEICQNGLCKTQSTCTNECSPAGVGGCSGTGYIKTCGNYDTDSCLEWSSIRACPVNKTCQNGYCLDTVTVAPACTNECSFNGEVRCKFSESKQTCGNYDNDSCLEWSASQICAVNKSCGYGTCTYTQRPKWSCLAGNCAYICYEDLTCK